MKNIILVIAALLLALQHINAQTGTENRDTVRLIIGGESITLPMPKEGNKVTVNLEDSAEIIQVSIGRVNKFKTQTLVKTEAPAEEKSIRRSHINWFREVELGTVTYLSRKTEFRNDSSIGSFYSPFTVSLSKTVSMAKITPHKVYPGLSFGFNIKEKSRPIKNTKLTFISGFKFRYSNYQSKGDYEIISYKYKNDSGVFRYYSDSIISISKGNYRASTNMYHLIFPFLIETGVKKDLYRVAAGLNLLLGFSNSKIITNNGENLKSSQVFISYASPQIIQIQPSVRLTKNRLSVQLMGSFTKNDIGFGPTRHRVGNIWYLNIGYKIY